MNADTLKPGDRVGYSAAFLRWSGGVGYDSASRRGTVESVEPLDYRHPMRIPRQIVYVRWDDRKDEPSMVLNSNIARVGTARFCDAGTP